MKHLKIIFGFLLIMLWAFELIAQSGSYNLRQIVPPSATAASLGKFGEVPVGLYTGIPNISIPIYEINDGGLNSSINLSYHAGGIKLEEIASNVGLGWALNAGGMVGRQVRGRPDEYGWITEPQYRLDSIMANGTQQDINQMGIDIHGDIKDGEADIYYYNFNGQSGKFFFDQAGNVYGYPARNIKVVPIAGDFESAEGWRITMEEGTVYEFNKIERVVTVTCGAQEGEALTAWYLSKIRSADGKREISFSYENVSYFNQIFQGQTMYFPTNGGSCLSDNTGCLGSNTTYTHRLTRIDFSGGYLQFTYNTLFRLDLDGEKSLQKIEVYTKSNKLIKGYVFAYDYFGSASPTQYGKRLKLLSVTEMSSQGVSKPPYAFSYEDGIEMPGRNSFAKDHWGFYNGKTSNAGLIPSFNYTDALGITRLYTGNADREANPDAMQACVLKNIKYPTGGETKFTYESNTVFDLRIPPKTYTSNISLSLNQAFSSLTSPYETSTFTIPSLGAEVKIQVDGLLNSENCDAFTWYLIKDNSTTISTGIDNSINGALITLAPGDYKFRFVFDCWRGNLNYSIHLTAKIPIEAEYGSRPAGGLRVKKVEDVPGNGSAPIVKLYKYESEQGESYGVLSNYPSYGYELGVESITGTPPNQSTSYCYYVVQSSTTNYPLTAPQGSFIGYKTVVEDLGDNGQIKHDFLTYTDPSNPFPFPPANNFEWRKGLEISTKYFAKKAGWLRLVKEVVRVDTGRIVKNAKGYMPNKNSFYTPSFFPTLLSAPVVMYPVTVEQHYIKSVIERTFDESDTSRYSETVTEYNYDVSHFQLIQTRASVSSGSAGVRDEIVSKKKYPQDYVFSGSASGSAAQGIKKLQDLHVVNVPVEEYSYRRRRNISTNAISDERVVGGMIKTFRSDNPYPDKLYRLETNTPIALSTYGTGSGLSSNSFIRNSNSTIANAYIPAIEFNNYDAKGNLTQQQKSNDVPHSYLWGYDTTLATAEVINASSNEIFFESFEEGGTWDSPAVRDSARFHTGRFSVRISNTSAGESTAHSTKWLTISSGVARKFRYSGWVYSNGPSVEIFLFMKRASETGYYSYYDIVSTNVTGKWVYLEKEYTVPSDVSLLNIRIDNNGSGTVWFDDIRLHPTNAMMTTYTYASLIGVTSVSDVNSKPSYYEYDAFNRLTLVRDDQGNIVKRICYNYAGQAEDCGSYYTSVVKSGSFTRNNCASGATAGTVTYTVAAGTYSSTISQADADAKAQNDVTTNGQAYANANAVCTWYSVAKSGSFTRNNCSSGATGGTVTYNVSAGAYSSTISQADADSKAQNDVNTNGQSYANANAACTWYSVAKSGSFTRNNCASGGTGGTITYNVSASAYTSTISQADADSKAQNDVNTNGQGYANTNASCTWYSAAVGANYYKSNCPSGYTSNAYYVSIAAGTYSSNVSQAAANALATNAAQAQADANGTCTAPQTTIYISNYSGNTYYVTFYNTATGQSFYRTMYPWDTYNLNVPVGYYSVTVNDDGYGYSTLLNVVAYTTYGTSAYFSNVYIGGTSNYVTFGD